VEKLYWLDQIQFSDRTQVGDKAVYLSRIMQRGYPVVPGFVIPADALRRFLENLHSSESLVADLPDSSLHLDVDNWRQLKQVAGGMRQEIISAEIPDVWVNTIFFAAQQWQKNCLILRPTVCAKPYQQEIGSISGLLESVFCPCHPQAIARGLKLVWSQLFRARSLLYWQKLGINLQKINLAILVQPIEETITSGLFSHNISGSKIEATWGLGVALTNGEVLPDTYYINQATGVVTQQELGNKMLAYQINHQINQSEPNASGSILPISPLLVEDNCLSLNLLEEAQQKQYSLTETDLQQLISLGNQLIAEMGTKLTFKWLLTASSPHIPANKLYITQVRHPQNETTNSTFIKGIGASRGKVTASAYVIFNSPNSPQKLTKIPQGVILVAPLVTPDWLPLLQEVAGIVTEQGGMTSHAAILSRELGIPAIVNARNATSIVQSGEKLMIDGERGEVYRLPTGLVSVAAGESEKTVGTQPILEVNYQPSAKHSTYSALPMIATKLLVNLSQSQLIGTVQNLPVDGLGLVRSELMMLNILEGKHPRTWLQDGRKGELLKLWFQQISQFAQAFAPRPVFYRSLDWRSPDLSLVNYAPSAVKESILGTRGTFSYLLNPDLFELELEALALVQGSNYTNVNLLLPFVRTVEEFVFCQRKVEQAGLTKLPQFQLWIMAEVPSILVLLPEFIKAGIAGVSIGTNDLTQLILGVDREDGQLAQMFDERHPAVMGAIAQIIKMAQAGGIPCAICGQAPAHYPEIIDQLVAWGITAISVEPKAVEQTYQAIARAEQHLILAAARQQINSQLN